MNLRWFQYSLGSNSLSLQKYNLTLGVRKSVHSICLAYSLWPLPLSQINTALPPNDITNSQFWKSSFCSWGVLLGEGDLIDQPISAYRVGDVSYACG
jgi:hypothetical protein